MIVSEGQEPSANPASEQPEAAAAQPTSARVDDAEVLRKEIAALRRENAKYRTRNDEETQAKLKEQGDFKSLYEKAQPDLEKARRYDAWAEREQARVDAEAKSLPPSLQKALALAGSLEDRRDLLEEFKAELQKAAPRTAPSAPAVGAPPTARKSLGDMSVEEYEALKRSDPDGFRAILSQIGSAPRSADPLSRYQGRKS